MTWQTGIIAGVGEVAFEVVDEPPIGPMSVCHLTMMITIPMENGQRRLIFQPWFAEQGGLTVGQLKLSAAQLVVRGDASEDVVSKCRAAWGLDTVHVPQRPKLVTPGGNNA